MRLLYRRLRRVEERFAIVSVKRGERYGTAGHVAAAKLVRRVRGWHHQKLLKIPLEESATAVERMSDEGEARSVDQRVVRAGHLFRLLHHAVLDKGDRIALHTQRHPMPLPIVEVVGEDHHRECAPVAVGGAHGECQVLGEV